MATVTETQTYLDEVKTPSVIGPGVVNNAFKALVSPVGAASQQVASWAALLQASEMTEPDGSLVGNYEMLFQKFGALVRELEVVRHASRDVVRSYRDFLKLDAKMRTEAAALGYIV